MDDDVHLAKSACLYPKVDIVDRVTLIRKLLFETI